MQTLTSAYLYREIKGQTLTGFHVLKKLKHWFSQWYKYSGVENPPVNAGDMDLTSDLGRYPGERMAIHSSVLAWKSPWTEEPGVLQSMGSQRVGHDLATEQQQQILKLRTKRLVTGGEKLGLGSWSFR